METELKIPSVGESITEVEIGDWLKQEGDPVNKDEPLVVIETEKATVELPAPESGTLSRILKKTGETAKVGEAVAHLSGGAPQPRDTREDKAAKSPRAEPPQPKPEQPQAEAPARPSRTTPVAERMLAEHRLGPEQVQATGVGGRVTKEDVLRHLEKGTEAPDSAAKPAVQEAPALKAETARTETREEKPIRMTLLRRTIAKRLVEAQHSAALLTTFNEVDMSGVMALRREYQEAFQKRNGIKLGFMSFFVKAATEALKQFPQLNAEIRGSDLVFRNYHDIGIAVSTERGLLVPVLRNVDRLSFAEIERAVADFGLRARENKVQPSELEGGTFTITNGGVFGSLLSTPLVNPPQSGILGMHAIQERPVALNGQVVIRPMMYVALTYDHRVVDGREAVLFLRRVKELVEAPARMLLEV